MREKNIRLPGALDDTASTLIELTGGRGPDAVIDAVGMEAHGYHEPRSTRLIEAGQKATGLLPDSLAAKPTDRAALDRLDALHTAVKAVRRGGTVSVSGVYGGEADPMPLMEMFDRGVQLRMGQAHVRRWIGDLLPAHCPDMHVITLDIGRYCLGAFPWAGTAAAGWKSIAHRHVL